MIGRIAKALPLALLLGCGASSPPPEAATPPSSGESKKEATSTTPSATPAATPTTPTITADATKKKDEGAQQPTPGKAQAGDPSIMTKITQEDILALVNKNGESFNKCYTLGAGSSKNYKAKVTVKATVSPAGSVNEVIIVSSTAKSPKVDACVVEAFKKLTFNRPAGSGATVFTFPLSFDGIEQVQ
jgi:TonB family protein